MPELAKAGYGVSANRAKGRHEESVLLLAVKVELLMQPSCGVGAARRFLPGFVPTPLPKWPILPLVRILPQNVSYGVDAAAKSPPHTHQ